MRETLAARPYRSAPPRRCGPGGAADRTVHRGHARRSYASGRADGWPHLPIAHQIQLSDRGWIEGRLSR